MNKNLGYYTCNGIEFESKIRACLHSVSNNNAPVDWVFNDTEFKKHNWLVEPELTMDQLYDQRSRQIREKYDYVVLSYSGGADSHNILMSFIRQGLHLDEIVVNTTEKANRQFTVLDKTNLDSKNAAAEHTFQTLPRLREIQNLIPRTKINVLDLSDHLFDTFTDAGDASWVLDKREGLNPAMVTRFNYIHFSDIRKQFDKDKKIALIVGIEKPRAFIDRGRLVMQFVDRAANIVTVADHFKEYTNTEVELFYWSPDAVPLLIKQGHVIKKWLEANPQQQMLWNRHGINQRITRLVHERIYRSLLYTTWDNSWWQADKAIKDWYSEFDQWFEDGYSDTEAYRVWQEGIDFVKTNLTPYLKRTDNPDGLQVYTKEYVIGFVKNLVPELKTGLF